MATKQSAKSVAFAVGTAVAAMLISGAVLETAKTLRDVAVMMGAVQQQADRNEKDIEELRKTLMEIGLRSPTR